jgi:rubrerythrin
MALNTCSEGISFSRELEEASAAFYEKLARLFPDDGEAFRGYAAANKKNVSNVERAYFGVITDALEGCYAFNIEPADYSIDVDVPEGLTRSDALAKAVALEEAIVRFYADAAEQSKGLMADVPRAFTMVARKRGERIDELKAKAAG